MPEEKQVISSHKQLVVWQKGMSLVDVIYQVSKNFPANEQFGLTAQMRRCAVSIPSNIAEGRVRTTTKDYVHFLHIALGSTVELDTQLEIALRQGFIEKVAYNETASLITEVGKMLSASISSLNTKR